MFLSIVYISIRELLVYFVYNFGISFGTFLVNFESFGKFRYILEYFDTFLVYFWKCSLKRRAWSAKEYRLYKKSAAIEYNLKNFFTFIRLITFKLAGGQG